MKRLLRSPSKSGASSKRLRLSPVSIFDNPKLNLPLSQLNADVKTGVISGIIKMKWTNEHDGKKVLDRFQLNSQDDSLAARRVDVVVGAECARLLADSEIDLIAGDQVLLSLQGATIERKPSADSFSGITLRYETDIVFKWNICMSQARYSGQICNTEALRVPAAAASEEPMDTNDDWFEAQTTPSRTETETSAARPALQPCSSLQSSNRVAPSDISSSEVISKSKAKKLRKREERRAQKASLSTSPALEGKPLTKNQKKKAKKAELEKKRTEEEEMKQVPSAPARSTVPAPTMETKPIQQVISVQNETIRQLPPPVLEAVQQPVPSSVVTSHSTAPLPVQAPTIASTGLGLPQALADTETTFASLTAEHRRLNYFVIDGKPVTAIAVVWSCKPAAPTRQGDYCAALMLVDPTMCESPLGGLEWPKVITVNCFSSHGAALPELNQGDVVLLHGLKFQKSKFGEHQGVGYKDRLRYCVFDSASGQYKTPNVSLPPGTFAPFYHNPTSAEVDYARALATWWAERKLTLGR